MRDEVRIDLENQLQEARAACQQAEESGAELAQRALESDEELKRLRPLVEQCQETTGAASKREIELEHWIALLVGSYIYIFACVLDGHGFFLGFTYLKHPVYLMSVVPSAYLCLRNSWHRFRIKHDWHSWRDNPYTNFVRQTWHNVRKAH